MMSALAASPRSGDSGTFSIATWNIRCGQNLGLASAAKGLAQMGIGAAILTEMKIMDNRYPKLTSGYKVISLKAKTNKQGGIALVWKEGHSSFKVEAARVVTPNLLIFQLVTGYKQFYVMGIYIPPNNTTGVDVLWAAWNACPDGCAPIVMGDLNICFKHPCNKWKEAIANLLNKINLVNLSRKYCLRQCWMQSARKRWTWRQKWMGRWHHSQPDYIMAWEGDIWYFRKVAFRSPLVHDSDHCAVVATFRARSRLTIYHRHRQCLPLQLPPKLHDKLTQTFKALKLTCVEANPQSRGGNDWISTETWRLISHRSMLRRTGKLCQTVGQRLRQEIWDVLRGDRRAPTAQVGNIIEAKLAGGNVQESFCHLKGWYRAVSETTTQPCPQTMVKQTAEHVELYRQQDPPGDPLPININPIPVDDRTLSKGEIRVAVAGLSNGRAGSALGMRAEDVKAWLHGIKLEEDPEVGPANIGAEENWRRFTLLVQAIWDHGKIAPPTTVGDHCTHPQRRGDYRGIGLLEPIWKVCKRVMDLYLNAFDLTICFTAAATNAGPGQLELRQN
jgi:hypothetical protein